MFGYQSSGEFVLISVNINGPAPRGELPYKSDRDASRPALGCKLQILVSCRVVGMESHYICPSRYRVVLYIKKFTKNALTLTAQKSPLGVSLKLSHTHISLPSWFNLNFPTNIPVAFIWESPPGAVPGCI